MINASYQGILGHIPGQGYFVVTGTNTNPVRISDDASEEYHDYIHRNVGKEVNYSIETNGEFAHINMLPEQGARNYLHEIEVVDKIGSPLAPEAGLRYNSDKVRTDLVPPGPIFDVAKVLTAGANKYADRNWEKGMKWTTVLASLERHFLKFKAGEDFDDETGLNHMAHVATNAIFLLEYVRTHPEYDDRVKRWKTLPKIGLDIDEVIADWVKHWQEYHGCKVTPEWWNFDKDIKQKFEEMKDNKEFWMSIPAKCKPSEIPFEPHCYVTSRIIPKEWTEEWIQAMGFPTVPVYCVGLDQSKLDVIKESGLEIFVDDRYENFHELNMNGVMCYLYDAPHNQRYDVGHMRIKSLQELVRKY